MIDITQVEITLASDIPANNTRLLAYASIELSGCFVVHDIRIVRARERVFVAMPSRKLMTKCPRCAGKNSVISNFCNECGGRLHRSQEFVKAHADVAHPINDDARDCIEDRVMEAYHDEVALAQSRPAAFGEASRKAV